MLPLELVDEVIHHPVVEILTAKMSVTSSGLDLEDAFLDGQDRHIKSSPTKIKDQHVALDGALLLVQAIGNGGGGGLVNDPENIETSDNSGILGGLPLRVVEVGRDRDHGVLHLGAEVGLSGLLHLDQNHGAHLLGSKPLVL